jgi:hypothetical protein
LVDEFVASGLALACLAAGKDVQSHTVAEAVRQFRGAGASRLYLAPSEGIQDSGQEDVDGMILEGVDIYDLLAGLLRSAGAEPGRSE